MLANLLAAELSVAKRSAKLLAVLALHYAAGIPLYLSVK